MCQRSRSWSGKSTGCWPGPGAVRWLGKWLVPAVIGDPLLRELLRRLPAAYHPRAVDASMRELRGTVVSAAHLLREEGEVLGGVAGDRGVGLLGQRD